jgi:hypothetical protein
LNDSKRKCCERFNSLQISKFEDLQFDRNFNQASYHIIEVSISTIEIKILSFETAFFLLAAIKNNTAVLVSAKTSGIKYLIGLEERPEKVIGDFTVR